MNKVIPISVEKSAPVVNALDIRRRMLFVVVTFLRDEGNAGNIRDYPYGVLSIIKHNAAVADLEVLDIVVNPDNPGMYSKELYDRLNSFDPDIVGISIMFDNAYFAIDGIARQVKHFNPEVPVVLGGPAVSPVAKQVLAHQSFVDAICFSEGEIPVRDLLMADNPLKLLGSHKSWITQADLGSSRNPEKTLLDNLDDVIDIDYSPIDVFAYDRRVSYNPLDERYVDDLRSFPIVTSRGCPFKCSFCWHSGEDDRSMRFSDVGRLIAHIESLIDLYGANCIVIYDDMLLLRLERAKEIFRRLIPLNLRVELPNGLSPTYIDEELVDLMYKAGVRSVRLAIESGDEWVVRHLVNKPLRIAQVAPVMEILKKYNYWVVGFFVVGIPGETDEHREKTRQMILEWGIDLSSISVASPIKGSLLYEQCLAEGFIESESEFLVSSFMFGENVINTKDFTAEYVSRVAYLMNLDVNFVNSSRLRGADIDTAEKYFTYIVRTYPNHAFGHYYLAFAREKRGDELGAIPHWNKALDIAENDEEWRSYFEFFDIDLLEMSSKGLRKGD